jgi:hypothetical protein
MLMSREYVVEIMIFQRGCISRKFNADGPERVLWWEI